MTSSTHFALERPKGAATPDYDVAIVGAGPYGLSVATHLRACGLSVCMFGRPMDFWANRMPSGMLLRSPRAASSISDPKSRLTLEAYERATGTAPKWPVPLTTFLNYGNWFSRQVGVASEANEVNLVTRESEVFRIALQKGQSTTSRRVVIAAGVGPFARRPNVYAGLPSRCVSHCYDGSNLAEFANRRVAVIGAGQSALESAALLHEAGSQVEVIARRPELRWIGGHKWLHRLGPLTKILYSKYDVGPVGISRLVSWPNLVFPLPPGIKNPIRVRAVRPAGAPWLVPRLDGVNISTGRSVKAASSVGEEVKLLLDDGTERRVDHVLLGTGYRVDVSRYDFLSPELLSEVRQVDGSPALKRGFSSSVPGLYFIGAAAARSFGPLLYFVAGTEYASRRLTAHVCREKVPAFE